jgi:hypothetical protein
MKKNYTIEFLYDNGIVESFKTGEMTENELNDFINVPFQAFMNGKNAVIQVPNKYGYTSLINVKKITRISIKE